MYLLNDLDISHCLRATYFVTIEAALHIMVNPVFHERAQHIQIDRYIVREKISS